MLALSLSFLVVPISLVPASCPATYCLVFTEKPEELCNYKFASHGSATLFLGIVSHCLQNIFFILSNYMHVYKNKWSYAPFISLPTPISFLPQQPSPAYSSSVRGWAWRWDHPYLVKNFVCLCLMQVTTVGVWSWLWSACHVQNTAFQHFFPSSSSTISPSSSSKMMVPEPWLGVEGDLIMIFHLGLSTL